MQISNEEVLLRRRCCLAYIQAQEDASCLHNRTKENRRKVVCPNAGPNDYWPMRHATQRTPTENRFRAEMLYISTSKFVFGGLWVGGLF